jgi:nitrous oxidase accessory protein NosD
VIRDCEIVANGYYGVELSEAAPTALIEGSSIKSNNIKQNPTGSGIGLFSAQRATIRDNDFGFNSYSDIYISGSYDNVIIRNVLDCAGAIINSGGNTHSPVNDNIEPDTNRTHRGVC